jgi:hypothetical protein
MLCRILPAIAMAFFLASPASADVSLLGHVGSEFRVALRAASTGYYVCAEPGRPLIADREWANVWEQFDLTEVGDGWFALKAHSNGKFVRFAMNQLVADRDTIGDTEKVKVHVLSEEHEIICLSTTARRLVCCNAGRADLVADRKRIGPWECFKISFRNDYDPTFPCPAGMQRKWVVADNDWHALEWGLGAPGIAFDAYMIGPAGCKARSQYFLTPPGEEKTLDGEHVTHIGVNGLYGEVAVKVPAAAWVYYSMSAGRVHTHVPFAPIELPPTLIQIPVDLFK